MPKPRRFSDGRARGQCIVNEDGERIVDTSIDAYDDAGGADFLIGYARWLLKASEWLKEEKQDEHRRTRETVR